MIVKIQRPLESSEPGPPALVYNQDRTFVEFVKFSRDLEVGMGGPPKVYCEAEWDGKGLRIIKQVPDQPW